ncbi:MAG TPA: DUF2812 domain-containing protein [Clostridia bacterium]|nr:DUF2812 domain-containing protein [Clostridia bacterium]
MSGLIVKYRPFWSFLVQDTEKWLETLAGRGLHIKSVDFKKNKFVFFEGEPVRCKYRFSYNKFETKRPQKENTLSKNGWEKLASYDKWVLYKTQNTNELNVIPNRRGIYLRNNSLLLIYNVVSFIILLSAFIVSFTLLIFLSPNRTDSSFFNGIFVIVLIFAVLIVANFLIFLRLSFTNSKILEEFGSSLNPQYAIYKHFIKHKTFEDWLEKLLVKEGDIVKVFRPFWIFSPDKFENWLETMEARGMNFYKIGKPDFLIYFIRGNTRKMKYCLVGNDKANLDDTKMLLESDWNIVYSTTGQFGKFVLISKSYEGKKPGLFRRQADYRANAYRIIFDYAALVLALLVILALYLVAAFVYPILFNRIWLALVAAVALLNVILIAKLAAYSVRVKKRSKSLK